MVGVDVFFAAGSFLFVERVSKIDQQWHGETAIYPGTEFETFYLRS